MGRLTGRRFGQPRRRPPDKQFIDERIADRFFALGLDRYLNDVGQRRWMCRNGKRITRAIIGAKVPAWRLKPKVTERGVESPGERPVGPGCGFERIDPDGFLHDQTGVPELIDYGILMIDNLLGNAPDFAQIQTVPLRVAQCRGRRAVSAAPL